jgi:glycosyltransferase involved in cell wall biosynthesis
MLVSVLVPVFNREGFIRAALSSLQKQTWRDLEILVQDDGSTDSTARIVAEMATEDPRVKVESFPQNRGVTAALNRLFARAAGELIAIQDSDDLAHPNKLARQVAFLNDNPAVTAVGTGCVLIDEGGDILRRVKYPPEYHGLHQLPEFCCASIMYRAAGLRQVVPWRTWFRNGADHDLIFRLGERARLSNLAEPLYLYRQHAGQLSRHVHPNVAVAIASRIYCATGRDDIVRLELEQMDAFRAIVADRRYLLDTRFKLLAAYAVLQAARRVGSVRAMVGALLFCSIRTPLIIARFAHKWLRNRMSFSRARPGGMAAA